MPAFNPAEAACLGHEDPELWFSHDPVHVRMAKEVCADCPVREGCLEYALDNNIRNGVWGGLDESEIRSLRRKLRLPVQEEQAS